MKIIDTIRKLQRHAKSAAGLGNTAEADAFSERARRLMAENNLTQEDIDASEVTPSEIGGYALNPAAWGQSKSKRRVAWAEQLAQVIACAHDCRTGIQPASNVLLFFGRREEVELSIFAFCRLARLAQERAKDNTRRAKKFYEQLVYPEWPGDKAFLFSFYIGFSAAIGFRYQQRAKQKDNRAVEVPVDALALPGKEVALNEFLSRAQMKQARSLSVPPPVPDGYFAGYGEGLKVELEVLGLCAEASGQICAPAQRTLQFNET
jgi:hypothetical protein